MVYRGKILAIMDSSTTATGYGNQAYVILTTLAKRGWDVYQIACNCFDLETVLPLNEDGYYHYKGIKLIKNPDLDMTSLDGVYPSKTTVEKIYNELNPDIVFTLNDFYRVKDYVDISKEFLDRWVHWLPVDNSYDTEMWSNIENKMSYILFCSAFGYYLRVNNLKSVRYLDAIYLGIFSENFKPLEKEKIKEEHGFNGRFVITTVARHQPRKMVYHTAELVGRFMKVHEDVIWVCKTNPDDGAMDNCSVEERDIVEIMKKHGVSDRVLFVPIVLSDGQMNELYNSGDVFIHLSGGEGFGLPYVESMLAGTPCILSDNTTSPELTGNWKFGLPVKVKEKKVVKDFNTYFDVADLESAYQQLEFTYNDWKTGSNWLKQAGKEAREFHLKWCDSENVVDKLEQLFQRVMRYNNKIVWTTAFGTGTGFSRISEMLIPEMETMGYDIYCKNTISKYDISDGHIKYLLNKYILNYENIDFKDCPNIVCWLMESFDKISGNCKIGWSLLESTKLSDVYITPCNNMNYIITSGEFNKQHQVESGIVSPLTVVSPCLNKTEFPELERTRIDGEPFTFLHIGVVQDRKNTVQMIEGYVTAFNDDGGTRLIIKSNHGGKIEYIKRKYEHRRDIEWIYTNEKPLTHDQLLKLYQRADCYINLSHGEGIGMPEMEALSTGIPVIGSNWDSRGMFLDDSVGWMIKISSMEPAYKGTLLGESGLWANYDTKDYIDTLRYVVEHRDEVIKKGHEGSKRIHEQFTVDKSAEQLDELLMKIYDEKKKKK